MKVLTDLLHLLLCNNPHVTDMMKILERSQGCCYYYLENDIAGGDDMPNHEQWHKITEQFKASLNLKSDSEALSFIRDAIQISQQIQNLADGNQKKLSFIKTIL